MLKRNKIQQTLFIIGAMAGLAFGQAAYSQTSPVLDNYIKTGIESNQALKQKELNLEKSLLSLKEANGLFFPSVTLESQYTLASGGRAIELPIGDLFNPVYSSLNQILQGMGQPGGFPQIENEKIEFLPNDYHDTKIRVILPLINAEIYYNRKIKKEMINSGQAEVNVYKRELIKEIKTSYIRYLQAIKVYEAYTSALELVDEALRVNKKLVENQMAGQEKIYRLEAEQNQVKAQLTKAENDKNIAASYFNFLLNQPLQSPVVVDSTLLNLNESLPNETNPANLGKREEIEQLNSGIKSTDLFVKMKKSYLIPTITNITDLGYQGNYFKFNNEQQYFMNTISLSWTLFNGFQNRRKIAQAKIESESLQSKMSEAELQIELQNNIAVYNVGSSIKSEEANKSSLKSSQEYYKVINKQYAQGQKSLLDLLDARNQLTSSQISYIVSHFETLIKQVELERASASYDLNSFNK
jgi:outer membrane protein TolC